MSVFGDCAIIFCHIQDIWPLDYSRSDSMSLESMLGPRVCLQAMMFHTLGSEAWNKDNWRPDSSRAVVIPLIQLESLFEDCCQGACMIDPL